MMEKIEVKIDSREVLGKKVKQLRRQGITPVHVIGRGVESKSLQCDTLELKQVLQRAGHTHLVNLKIGKERKVHPALVREVQLNPITREILHVDFYQVQMAEKVKMEVPVLVIGESPLMKQKDTLLEHELTALTVECLPSDIPASIEVDITGLVKVGQPIRVSDLVLPAEVSVLNEPEQLVLKIDVMRGAAAEEAAADEEAAGAPAAAEAAPAEAAPESTE
jgi:large subunit ribosomal protein L25